MDNPKEPKKYWAIDWRRTPMIARFTDDGNYMCEFKKSIGNYFSSREEAEKAVERLRAWKRLKDKGFRITLHGCKGDYSDILSLFEGEE